MKWRKWVAGLVGVAIVLAGTSTAVLAAHRIDEGDRTDQGTTPADRNWQLGFTPSYSTGKFGTDLTSSFFYAPISIRRLFRDGDVTLIIPFVIATTDGSTTLVGGRPVRVDDNPNSGSGTSGGGGSADDSGCSGKGQSGSGKNSTCGTTTRTPGQNVTTAGLGDIILRGRYYVVEEKDYIP